MRIYDTDFNPLYPEQGIGTSNHGKTQPVLLKENVFIGAHTIILKGVTVGRNSVVGAGSVVTKSIPDNEIWGGAPARYIKKL